MARAAAVPLPLSNRKSAVVLPKHFSSDSAAPLGSSAVHRLSLEIIIIVPALVPFCFPWFSRTSPQLLLLLTNSCSIAATPRSLSLTSVLPPPSTIHAFGNTSICCLLRCVRGGGSGVVLISSEFISSSIDCIELDETTFLLVFPSPHYSYSCSPTNPIE